MHLQSLKLLPPTIWEEMHLQEKTLYDLDLGHKMVAQYSLHYVTYAPAKIEVATSNSLGGDAFTRNIFFTFGLDLVVKVIQNVAQYPLHHVTYSPAKFEVATFNPLDGEAFTRKYII